MLTKPYLYALSLAGAMIAGLVASPLCGQQVVVGVNLVDPYSMNSQALDEMLNSLHGAGVHVIRASITPNDAGVEFAARAWSHGIKIEWLIYRFGGYEPGGSPLSTADPAAFRETYAPVLAKLEAKGIKLVALELGNELNLSGYNSDFPRRAAGMQFGARDMESNAEARQVAKGLMQYLKVLAVLKEMRDSSRLNRNTPILTAGFSTLEKDDGPRPGATTDLVSTNATLDFLRAHGVDKLVDAYAVHVYPSGEKPGNPAAEAERTRGLAKYVLDKCRPAGSSDGKPCWITEWGFNNASKSCPINDDSRAVLAKGMMEALRPYVKEGRLSGVIYYCWNTVSLYAVYRCGSETKAGKVAVDETLLR